jgi:hypothetical protein
MKTALLACVLSIVTVIQAEVITLQPKKCDLSKAVAAMNTVKIDMNKAVCKPTTILPVIVR